MGKNLSHLNSSRILCDFSEEHVLMFDDFKKSVVGGLVFTLTLHTPGTPSSSDVFKNWKGLYIIPDTMQQCKTMRLYFKYL